MEENKILLRGQVLSAPVFSHESHAKPFFQLPLLVPRLSGTSDTLNLILTEGLAQGILPGQFLEVEGEVRSFNNRSGSGSRLVITVYVRSLRPCEEGGENQLTLSGILCKPPIHRYTPLGREICDLMLAVPRRYGRTDYLPCIAWGSLAQLAADWPVGTHLCLEGRLQSRTYTKQEADHTVEKVAYEVSVCQFCPE